MNRFLRAVTALSLLAVAGIPGADAADQSTEVLLIRVTIVDRDRELPRLQRLGLDVAGTDSKA